MEDILALIFKHNGWREFLQAFNFSAITGNIDYFLFALKFESN